MSEGLVRSTINYQLSTHLDLSDGVADKSLFGRLERFVILGGPGDGPGFSRERREELSDHELGGGLDQALAYAGQCAADVHFSEIIDFGGFAFLAQVECSCASEKTGGSLPVDDHLIVFGFAHFSEFNRTIEDAFDRADACLQTDLIRPLIPGRERLAARYAALQDLGIGHQSPQPFPGTLDFIRSFDFHLIFYGCNRT